MQSRNLNYRHLRAFWAVATDGQLTRAAERLHVSQSALSTQIRDLEAEIGHPLFDREGRRMKLTEMGHLVLGYAEGIFSLGDELVAAVNTGTAETFQRLRIGGVATLSRNYLDEFLRPIVDKPNIQLQLEFGTLKDLLARLAVHNLDLVLSNIRVRSDSELPWRCRRITRQPVCLIGAPLPRGRRFRFPQDLQGRRLLLPGPNSDVRAQFDLVCEDLDFEPTILAEVDDMATIRLLVRGSDNVALVPMVVVREELKRKELQKYCEVPRVFENFYAVTIKRRFQPDMIKELLAEAGVGPARTPRAAKKETAGR
jgi:LysR family transcriptional activator of nhaA